jgi:hypothetical protein
MFGFSPGELVNLCPDERLIFVQMISAMLRRSGGDAGGLMFEAYRHIVSDTNRARRSCMLDLLESVRQDYIQGGSASLTPDMLSG